jgi:diguanylate cyclase (GGDEF)-like protein
MSFGLHPALLASRLLAAILLLAGACAFAADEDPGALLKHADDIKTADNTQFQALLKQAQAQADRLTPAQIDFLDYLRGWQSAYTGNFDAAETTLQAVIGRTPDATVRARALITLVNSQALAARYEDAYSNLSKLLEMLPNVQDHEARNTGYGVAALLNNQAGQFDLAIQYADLWLDDSADPNATCKAMSLKVEALYKLGKLSANSPAIGRGIQACQRVGEPLWGNIILGWQASALMDGGQADKALSLLNAGDAQELATHYPAAIGQFRTYMARAALLTGDLAHAREYAQSAIDLGPKRGYPKFMADTYDILYQVAKRQGDEATALAFHEKYDVAKTGYTNDISARALAYQQVHQQVLDKQRQIDAANDKNKMLALQQQVDAQQARARLLYIGLLAMGLLIVVGWAYRTKRSQLKFQKLARRDGLTGICNRQHFFDSAQDALRYCARSAREASLLVLDLDHFKSVNDMHGHAAGDEALRRVVAACESRLRSIDIFGRLGGEEFAILLPDCTENIAALRAEEMRADIAGLPRFDAYADVLVTASFGVASSRVCGYNLATLLANADGALYLAKDAGRNKVVRHKARATVASA